MWRKVVVSVFLIGLVALLVVGAVNRTLARTALESGQQTGRGAGSQASSGQAGGRTEGDLASDGQASGGQGRGGQSGGRGQAVLTEVAPVDWQTLTGVVTQIDGEALVLTLDSGEVMLVEGQPWRYAQAQTFAAAVGERVTVAGYPEDEEFKTGMLTNTVSGMSVQLRDAAGRPAWSGQGLR